MPSTSPELTKPDPDHTALAAGVPRFAPDAILSHESDLAPLRAYFGERDVRALYVVENAEISGFPGVDQSSDGLGHADVQALLGLIAINQRGPDAIHKNVRIPGRWKALTA